MIRRDNRRPCVRCAMSLLTMGERWPKCVDVASCAERAALALSRMGIFPDVVAQSIPRVAARYPDGRPLALVSEPRPDLRVCE